MGIRVLSNTCFLGPTRVHNPNGISIGSAVLAQLIAESPYTLQWAPLSPKIADTHGVLDPHLAHDSSGSPHPSPQLKRHLDRCSRFCRASVLDRETEQTDRPTDHDIRLVTIGGIYASYVVLRCGLIIPMSGFVVLLP